MLPTKFGLFGYVVSEEKFVLEINQSETINCLWRPCLITDRDKMGNLDRQLFKDASYQVSVHLAMRFQSRRFFNIGQSETRIACGGHVCCRIGTK
jgi:hypothetical protein